MTAPRKGKTGSRNPASKPTSVAAWKKSAAAVPMEMPSGNYMRVRKVGMQAIIKTGIMPNSLMGIAQKAVEKGQTAEPTNEELMSLIEDPAKVQEIGKFMDELTILCAEEPKVHRLPDEGVEKDDELLYIDEVDEEDKMFIFQVVTGGTTDIETFRDEVSATMVAVRGREDLELPAE